MGGDLSRPFISEYIGSVKLKSIAVYEAWVDKYSTRSISAPFLPLIKTANCSTSPDSVYYRPTADEIQDLEHVEAQVKKFQADIDAFWFKMRFTRPLLVSMAQILGFFGSNRGYEALELNNEQVKAQTDKFAAEKRRFSEIIARLRWRLVSAYWDNENMEFAEYLIPTSSPRSFKYIFRDEINSEMIVVTLEGGQEVFRKYSHPAWRFLVKFQRQIR